MKQRKYRIEKYYYRYDDTFYYKVARRFLWLFWETIADFHTLEEALASVKKYKEQDAKLKQNKIIDPDKLTFEGKYLSK